jgi:hypothetical protein
MVDASDDPVRPDSVLSAVFDKGLSRGLGTLTRVERQLFLIQDFIIETEMGGLSGYLFNRVASRGRLAATATAMEVHDVRLLAPIVGELQWRFRGYRSRRGATWDDACGRHLSDARLAVLEAKLDRARDKHYGLGRSKMAALALRPRWAITTRTWLEAS